MCVVPVLKSQPSSTTPPALLEAADPDARCADRLGARLTTAIERTPGRHLRKSLWRTSITTTLLVAALLGAQTVAVEPVHADTAKASAQLPLATRFATELKRRSSEALHRFAASTLSRLLLDEQNYAVDSVTDIADLVVAITALDILEGRRDAPADTWRLAAQAASILHRLGWVYRNDPDLRRRISRYVRDAKTTKVNETATQLQASMVLFQEVGAKWLPRALKAALARNTKDALLINLRGLWLKQSGKLKQAGAAFDKAFTLEPRPVFALNAYEVAIARDSAGAEALYETLSKRLPAVKGALNRIRAEFLDRRATKAFESGPSTQAPAALLAQAERYVRQGARHKGDALVKEALAEVGAAKPETIRAAVRYWMQSRRDSKGLALLAQRPELTRGDTVEAARWRSQRLALAMRTRLDALSGGMGKPSESVRAAWKTLDQGLLEMRQRGGVEALHADVLELFLGIRESSVAQARNDDVALSKAKARLSKARRILRTKHAAEPLAGLARTGAALASEGPSAATEVLAKVLTKVKASHQPTMGLLLAEQEVGLGLRNGQGKLVRRGLKRLSGLKLPATNAQLLARRDYLLAVAPWLLAASGGSKVSASSSKQALKALEVLASKVDPESPAGARYAGAIAWSLGTIALSVGNKALAHRAFQRARRFVERPLHPFAGAVASLAKFDDAYAASALLEEALKVRTGAPLAFALNKWRALAAQKRGDAAGARRYLTRMLKLAKPARAPAVVSGRTGSPLLIGDLAMTVGVEPLNKRGAVDVEITGVLFALPDFAHDLSEIRAMIPKLPGRP